MTPSRKLERTGRPGQPGDDSLYPSASTPPRSLFGPFAEFTIGIAQPVRFHPSGIVHGPLDGHVIDAELSGDSFETQTTVFFPGRQAP